MTNAGTGSGIGKATGLALFASGCGQIGCPQY
jgi:hypothetical protein